MMTDNRRYDRVGPIHRSVVFCYDCGAQPGQRHTAWCELAPQHWDPYGEDVWGQYVPTVCDWCGEPPGDELGPIEATCISPPVSGWVPEFIVAHAGCSSTAAMDMVQ